MCIRDSDDGSALYKAVQDTVDEVKKAGADYVIALAHLGNEGITDIWTSKAVIANTTGIDAMLDGHDHETLTMKVANKDGKEIILAEAGQADGKLATIGKLTIKEDGTITSELVAAKDVTVKDKTVDAYVQNILNSFKESVSQVVAKSDVELPDYCLLYTSSCV